MIKPLRGHKMASRTFEFKLIGIFFYFCPKIPQKKFQLDRPQIENFKASEHSREGCARPSSLVYQAEIVNQIHQIRLE